MNKNLANSDINYIYIICWKNHSINVFLQSKKLARTETNKQQSENILENYKSKTTEKEEADQEEVDLEPVPPTAELPKEPDYTMDDSGDMSDFEIPQPVIQC